MDSFLKELRAKNAADLNAVLVTFNEGSLCREAVGHWVLKRWITIAPHSPLTAIAGPEFRRDITLPEFCGREEGAEVGAPPFDVSDEGGKAEIEEGDREKT